MVGFKPDIGRETWKEFVIVCWEACIALGCLSSISCIRSLTRFLAVSRPSGCLKTFSKTKDVSAVLSKGDSLSMACARGGRGSYGLAVRTPRQRS